MIDDTWFYELFAEKERTREESSQEYKAAGDLAFLNARYHSQITQTLINFFNGENIAASRNVFKRATVEAFSYAFDLGYTDSGGKLPTDRESNDWLVARVEQEFGHIQLLYQQAKDIRKEKESYFQWVTDRADGYTRTLRDIYSMGKLRAMGNTMLTFTGPDGSPEHICQKIGGTCVKLKGKRHRASWWVNHDLMPYRGNPAFDCGGWECQHYLEDDEGNRITLGGGSHLKFNPDQPREPRGTPTGGQWSSTAGAIPYGVEVGPGDFVVRIQLEDLPEEHLDGLGSIKFNEGDFIHVGVIEAFGIYEPWNQNITLATNADNVAVFGGRTLIHEVGHHVHLYKMNDEGASIWNEISDNGNNARISAYARTNRGEHFADVYRAYQSGGSDRARLKTLEPRSYQFMRNINKYLYSPGQHADLSKWEERYGRK